jgi:HlyD family secretion protein
LGQAASVTTDTYPDKRYAGRISFISNIAEFTPKSVETHDERVTLVYRIKIDLNDPSHELKPGMPADATIDLHERAGGYTASGAKQQSD